MIRTLGPMLIVLFLLSRAALAAPLDARALLWQSDIFHDEYRQDLKAAEASVQQLLKNSTTDRGLVLLAAARIARLQGAFSRAVAYLDEASKVPNQDFSTALQFLVERRLLQLERFAPLFGGYSAITADMSCNLPELKFQAIRFNADAQSLVSRVSNAGKSVPQKQREEAEAIHMMSIMQWAEASFVLRELAQHAYLPSPMLASLTDGLTRAESSFSSQSATSIKNGLLSPEQRQILRQRLFWPVSLRLHEEKNAAALVCPAAAGGAATGDPLSSLACAEVHSFPTGNADDLGLLIEAPGYAPVAADHRQKQWRARQPAINDRTLAARPFISATRTQLTAQGNRRGLVRLLYLEAAQKIAAALDGQLPANKLDSLIPELELVAAAASEVGDRRLLRQAVAMGALVRSLYSPTTVDVDWIDKLVKLSIQDGDYGQLLGWGRIFAAAASEQAYSYFRPDVADVLYTLAVRFYQAAGAQIEASQAIERWTEVLQATGATSRALGLLKQGIAAITVSAKSCQAKPFPPGELFLRQGFLLADYCSIASELLEVEALQSCVKELSAFSEEVVKSLARDPDIVALTLLALPQELHLDDLLLNQAIRLLLTTRRAAAQLGSLMAEAAQKSSQPGSEQAAARARWQPLFMQYQTMSDKALALQTAAIGAYNSILQKQRVKQLTFRQDIKKRADVPGNICDQDPRTVRQDVLIRQSKELAALGRVFEAGEPYLQIIMGALSTNDSSGGATTLPGFLNAERLRNEMSAEARLLTEERQFLLAQKKLARLEKEQGANWYTLGTRDPWSRLELYSKVHAGLYQSKATTAQSVLGYTRRMIELFERRRIATRDDRMRARLFDLAEGQYLYATAVTSASIVGSVGETLEYVERAKARALQERLLAENNPAALRARNLGSALNLVEESLERNGCTGTTTKPPCPALQKQAKTLLGEYEDQRQRSPLLTNSASPSVAELVGALPPQTALLDYYVAGDSVIGVLLSKSGDKAVFRRLVSTSYLEQVVRRVGDAMARGEEPKACDLSWLAKLLLPDQAQLASLLKNSAAQLWLVPHGPLHDVPFAALPIQNGRLIERFVLRELPYAGLLLRGVKVAAPNQKPAVLYFNGNPGDRGRTANAKPEAEAVAQLYGVAAQEVKTRQHFLSELRDRDGVYFVGHAAGGSKHGQFSRIVLPRVSAEDDGALSVFDIVTYPEALRARWVVLSACETARGDRTSGDEGIGIARALLQKGVRTVLANLVSVSTAEPTQFLDKICLGLRAGTDPALALAQAQRQAIHQPVSQWAKMIAIGGTP